MISRKQKVEALMESIHSMRRRMIFRSAGSRKTPRITSSQWGALMAIEQHGSSTLKDMAESLGITSSAATQLVDGLVASEYVTRGTNVEDRRAITLTLSKKTKEHITKMKKQMLQKFLNFFDVLNDTELDQFLLLNKKIVAGFLKK
jgi:DNA-binding MarR family transcriptional regulator